MKERVGKLSLWTVAWLIIVVFTYLVLVIGDYAYAKYLYHMNENVLSGPVSIEKKRELEEDRPQRNDAIKLGFEPLIYPDAVEFYEPLSELVEEIGVAPLAAQPNTQIYYCNEGYGLVTYRSDRFGFRNDDVAWDRSDVDLVLIGDSFAQGACVKDKDTITSHISSEYKVLNLGTQGNHPVHYAALAKKFIRKIRPKTVVLLFYANDNMLGNEESPYYKQYIERNTEYFTSETSVEMRLSEKLNEYYVQSKPIVKGLISAQLDDAASFLGRGNLFDRAKKYLLLSTIRKQIEKVGREFFADDSELHFSSKLAVDTLVDECHINDCIPVVAYIPNSTFWRPDPRSTGYSELLSEYSKEKGTFFIDLTESIRADDESNYAVKGPHLSPKGYKIVADNLLDFMREL